MRRAMVTLLTRLGISWRKLSIGGRGWDLVHRVLSLHFPFSLTEGSLCLWLIGSKVSSRFFQSHQMRGILKTISRRFNETKTKYISWQPQLQQTSMQCLSLIGSPCASITASSYPFSLPFLTSFPLPVPSLSIHPLLDRFNYSIIQWTVPNRIKVTRFLHIGEKSSISREEAKSDGHSTHQPWNSLWERG